MTTKHFTTFQYSDLVFYNAMFSFNILANQSLIPESRLLYLTPLKNNFNSKTMRLYKKKLIVQFSKLLPFSGSILSINTWVTSCPKNCWGSKTWCPKKLLRSKTIQSKVDLSSARFRTVRDFQIVVRAARPTRATPHRCAHDYTCRTSNLHVPYVYTCRTSQVRARWHVPHELKSSCRTCWLTRITGTARMSQSLMLLHHVRKSPCSARVTSSVSHASSCRTWQVRTRVDVPHVSNWRAAYERRAAHDRCAHE